jgi:hypothetical protein
LHIRPVSTPPIPPERPDVSSRAFPAARLEKLPVEAGLIRELSDLDMERLIDILELPAAETPESLEMGLAKGLDTPLAGQSGIAQQTAALAKMGAESKLESAQQLVTTEHPHRASDWEAKPEALLRVAHRLFEAGGEQNYARAGEVAQIVIDMFTPVPGVAPTIAQAVQTGRGNRSGSSRGRLAGERNIPIAAWVVAVLAAGAVLLYLLER